MNKSIFKKEDALYCCGQGDAALVPRRGAKPRPHRGCGRPAAAGGRADACAKRTHRASPHLGAVDEHRRVEWRRIIVRAKRGHLVLMEKAPERVPFYRIFR